MYVTYDALVQINNNSAMSIHKSPVYMFGDYISNQLVTYFMSGIRPIESIVKFTLGEQALTCKFYN